MSQLRAQVRRSHQGVGKMGCFVAILAVILLIFIGDMGLIQMSEYCLDEDPIDCIMQALEEEDEEEEGGTVTATGTISGTYGKQNKSYAVNVTMTLPLKGGAVTGEFSGDCDGKLKATYNYDGDKGGTLTGGVANGSCGFLAPASATFGGNVNQTAKTVFASGEGKVAIVFKGNGSVTLSY